MRLIAPPYPGRKEVLVLGLLEGLVGKWTVSGHAHNEPIQGLVEARLAVNGAWLLAQETLFDPVGARIHQDLCVYGRDPISGDLLVHHFQEGGVVAVHTVLPTTDGLGVHWVPCGAGPRVELRHLAHGWQVRVFAPEQTIPEIQVDYRPTT
jgi:hypothetical protein